MLGASHAPASVLWWWVGGIAAGCAAAFAWLRFGVGHAERLRRLLTKKSQLERNRRTDVREIDQFLPAEIGGFDPLHFVQPDRGFFVGLDEFKNPIFIPCDAWRLSHVLLSGRTRSGSRWLRKSCFRRLLRAASLWSCSTPSSTLDASRLPPGHALRAGQLTPS